MFTKEDELEIIEVEEEAERGVEILLEVFVEVDDDDDGDDEDEGGETVGEEGEEELALLLLLLLLLLAEGMRPIIPVMDLYWVDRFRLLGVLPLRFGEISA